MPQKNTLTPVKIVSALDLSVAGVQHSAAQNVLWMDDLSLQFNVTGSPVGSVTIEASLDYAQTPFNAANPGNWTILSTTAISAAGTTLVQIQPQAVPWIRVTYTMSSGTGAMDVFMAGKAI